MKVQKLIELLSKEDPSSIVILPGYEGGVDEVQNITQVQIYLDYNIGTWHYGDHEICDRYNSSELDTMPPDKIATAILVK